MNKAKHSIHHSEASPVAIKLKEKKAGMRACDEKGAKGNLCCGHLKRWYTPDEEVVRELGKNIEIYRCERCQALYRPAANDRSTAGQKYDLQPVNLLGDFSRKASEKQHVDSDK